METFFQDIRFGLRMLAKRSGFTLIAAVALALGIGTNTAIFSVINAVLLRPLPYRETDRLVLVQESLPKLGLSTNAVSGAEFLEYQQGNEVLSEIAGFYAGSRNLTGQGEAKRVQAARVSASLFPMLGVQPIRGRTFSPDEDQPGRDKVVVLSERLWRAHFGEDDSIIGQTIKLNEVPYTVIGVMPARFQFPSIDSTFAEAVDMWVPLALTNDEKKGYANSFDYGVIGRLKPGVTVEQAQANLSAVAERFQQEHRNVYQGNVEVVPSVVSMEEKIVGKVRLLLLVLLGAVAMVLLVACANVANLLLARASARQKEIAVRSALGASRLRIVRQLLTESLLLSLVGGAGGLIVAVWTIDLIVRFGPSNVPRLKDVGLDSTVLFFTVFVSLLTGILFGIAPALQVSRIDLNEILKEAGGRAASGREGKRTRALLVIFEIATATVLLTGAGLLMNSFIRLINVGPGFDPEGVVIARTTLPRQRYPRPEMSKSAHRRVIERLAALPGVKEAGATSSLPLVGDWSIGFAVEGRSSAYTANGAMVTDGYFGAMGIDLVRGRTFTGDDHEGSVPVVVINETMARKIWPGEDAIGKRIKWGSWKDAWLTVVGIVEDVKVSSLEAETKPAVYLSMFQPPISRPDVVYVVRSSVDGANLADALRSEIKAVDEELPIYDLRSMNQVISESVSQRRFSMLLIAAFAAMAMLLAAVGIYGVMSYAVSERTREIGIRSALGANAAQVMRLILGQAMALVMAGVALGLAGSLALTRLMASMLYKVSATDPLTFVIIATLLSIVALAACFAPARRATRVDPVEALRHE